MSDELMKQRFSGVGSWSLGIYIFKIPPYSLSNCVFGWHTTQLCNTNPFMYPAEGNVYWLITSHAL